MIASIFGNGMMSSAKSITVKQGIDDYEDYYKVKNKLKSLSRIQTSNRKLLEFFPGRRILNTIEKRDAEKLYEYNIKTAPIGAGSYNQDYKVMFNKFKEWNYVNENPFNIKTSQRQKAEPVAIPSDEINMICERLRDESKIKIKIKSKCKSDSREVIADMVLFDVESGLRLAEEANLRWSDIDFRNKIVTVGNKQFQTKTKRIRKIPFNSRMEEILQRCSARQLKNGKILREFVFAKPNGKPFALDTISKAFKKVCRELELPEEYHWHCLRSTAASNWVNRQVPIYTVSKLLGHSNVRTTQIYAKVDLEELRDAINKL